MAEMVLAFPSPQGGSETKKVCLSCSEVPGFHPLKAGRRPLSSQFLVLCRRFPSPQGGSETQYRPTCYVSDQEFPSPQGGSETHPVRDYLLHSLAFPSPQGGSETIPRSHKLPKPDRVSIPSRRVGDEVQRCQAQRHP